MNTINHLKQHDLIFEKLPARWLDGIPLGNGNMGAMIWGYERGLYVTLDRNDIWETRYQRIADPRYNYQTLRRLIEEQNQAEILAIFEQNLTDDSNPHVTRMPLPRLRVEFDHAITHFSARLALQDAVVNGTIRAGAGPAGWLAFLHADVNLFVYELEKREGFGEAKAYIDTSIFDRECNSGQKTTINAILRKWGYPPPVVTETGALYTWYQERPGQAGYAVSLKRDTQTDLSRFYVSIASSRESADPAALAQAIVHNAAAQGRGKLLRPHKRFWHSFWSKSELSIPDAKMENLFYAELYKLGCNSRAGKIPCSLQGVWTQGDGCMPPWRGEYAMNMNVQETYWPVYAANHLECGDPLYEEFWKNLPFFQQRCRDFFGFEGAHAPPGCGLRGEPVAGWCTCDFWPGAGAWLAHHFWLHWLYSQDKSFLLARAYPFMRAFMRTYLNLAEKDENGTYHLPVSHSPEYHENLLRAWGRDVTGDLYLMRWLAAALLQAADILAIEDPDMVRWQDLLDHLAEPPQNESGLMLFQGQSLDESHRHFSHLMGIHPLGNLTMEDSDAARDLIRRSIDHIRLKGTGAWTGWSFPWMSLIASRVGNGQMAWQMLQDYFGFINTNTLHINGDPRQSGNSWWSYDPMTLEGGFCYAAAVMEMLMQSWGGIIRVFPSIPEFWHDVCFRTLRAEGAFLVTSKMVRHQVAFIEIRSEAGGACRIQNPFAGQVCLRNETAKTTQLISGTVLTFHTQPGELFHLHAAGSTLAPEDLALVMQRRRPEESNWFGLKTLARF